MAERTHEPNGEPTVDEAALTPEGYPADVHADVSASDLELFCKKLLDPDDQFGEHTYGGWPPEGEMGNVYPIFFTPDELSDTYGKLYDDHGTRYSPFAGALEPIFRPERDIEACNAPLSRWRSRFPEIRFCGYAIYTDDRTYCKHHRGRINNMKTAEEQLQTGLFTKSIDNFYDQLGPWKRLIGWGTFESLMGESTTEFAPEYQVREFDFGDEDVRPDGVEEDGILRLRCGYPTQHVDPALSLYVAAMMSVQMMTVQPRIMFENREAGEGMMETKTIEAAQLTAPPSEHDPSPQEFETLETWSEHHLNLPFSRLVRDQPKLLERGGVDPEADSENDSVDADDIVLEIQADPDEVDTTDVTGDPNEFEDMKPESQRIVEHATDDE
jgi:hypothetical protein